jgi:hypothetical protein
MPCPGPQSNLCMRIGACGSRALALSCCSVCSMNLNCPCPRLLTKSGPGPSPQSNLSKVPQDLELRCLRFLSEPVPSEPLRDQHCSIAVPAAETGTLPLELSTGRQHANFGIWAGLCARVQSSLSVHGQHKHTLTNKATGLVTCDSWQLDSLQKYYCFCQREREKNRGERREQREIQCV